MVLQTLGLTITEFDSATTYYTYDSTTETITQVARTAAFDDKETYYVLFGNEVTASSGTNKNTAVFSNLDAGGYVLVESVTPAGYNTASPIEFTIEFDETTLKWQSTSVSGYYNVVSLTSAGGAYASTVQNNAGVILASTGGMGTTILYIIGAILVIGAAVLLITRRRMANK